MVRVVLVGGAGQLGREIATELAAQKKHEVIIWSRKDLPELAAEGLQSVQVPDYQDKGKLVKLLKGIDVVLSFVGIQSETDIIGQRNLIDACIEAGVKRFAPSEWFSVSNSEMPLYAGKDAVAAYLQEINKNGTVLEYCKFQPGLFMDYLAHPYSPAKFVTTFPIMFDMENARAISVEDGTANFVLTTVRDVTKVVAQAIDYPKPWPVDGGMIGTKTSMAELVRLGEKLTGRLFDVQTVKVADLQKGEWKAPWLPKFLHVSMTPEQVEYLSKPAMISLALAIYGGKVEFPPTWNELLPDFRFWKLEEFLQACWKRD